MLFRIPIINALCNSSCALSFISTAFDVVFVLYCYTPVERGGLNLSVRLIFTPVELQLTIIQIAEIGYALAVAGFSSTLLQIFIVPVILLKCDHFKLYYFFMRCWPWTFLSMPILHVIAKATNNEASHTGAGLWVAIAAVVALSKVSCLAYAYVQPPAHLFKQALTLCSSSQSVSIPCWWRNHRLPPLLSVQSWVYSRLQFVSPALSLLHLSGMLHFLSFPPCRLYLTNSTTVMYSRCHPSTIFSMDIYGPS